MWPMVTSALDWRGMSCQLCVPEPSALTFLSPTLIFTYEDGPTNLTISLPFGR